MLGPPRLGPIPQVSIRRSMGVVQHACVHTSYSANVDVIDRQGAKRLAGGHLRAAGRRPPLKGSSSNLRRASLPFFPLPVCVPGAQVAGVIRGEENLTIENGADSTPRESSGRALATASNPLRAASSSVSHGNRPSSGRGRRRPPNGEREEGHRFRSRETACGPPVFTACHGGAQETRPHVGDESVGQTSEAYRGIRGRASSGSHVSAHKAVDASHRSSRTPPPVVGARSP
jgi:hypothetical protein